MLAPEVGKPSGSPTPPSHGESQKKILAPETEIFQRWTHLSSEEMHRTKWNTKEIQATEIKICEEVRRFINFVGSRLDSNAKASFSNFAHVSSIHLHAYIGASNFDNELETFQLYFRDYLSRLNPKDFESLDILARQGKAPDFIIKTFDVILLKDKWLEQLNSLPAETNKEKISAILKMLAEFNGLGEQDLPEALSQLVYQAISDLTKQKDLASIGAILDKVQSQHFKVFFVSQAVDVALKNELDYMTAIELSKESPPLRDTLQLKIGIAMEASNDLRAAVPIFEGIREESLQQAVSLNLSNIVAKLIANNDLQFARAVIDKIPLSNIKAEALASLAVKILRDGNIAKARNIETTDPAIRKVVLSALVDELINQQKFDLARELAYEMHDEAATNEALARIFIVDSNPRAKKML